MREFNYESLDPGIRETVRWLNARGFETTDSGDGVTKFAAGYSTDEAFDVPHVFIHCNPHDIWVQSTRLLRELTEAGFCVEPVGHSAIYIQATYDPADDSALIALFGVSDAGFR